MKILLLTGLLSFAAISNANIPPDQLGPSETKAISGSEEIVGILNAIAAGRKLNCPTLAPGDVALTPGPSTSATFQIVPVCKETFGTQLFQVTFSGDVMWIGGDIDIAVVTLNTVQIVPIF